jgi:hypothetical protein
MNLHRNNVTINKNMSISDYHNKDPQKIKKTELIFIFKNIIKHIKSLPEGHFRLKKMRGVCGVCEWGDGITLDHRKPIIPTLIHEVLHDMFSDNNEEWVLRVESKIMQILTPKDVHRLMCCFLSKLEIKN